jgi:opacity protein-like surface antigen
MKVQRMMAVVAVAVAILVAVVQAADVTGKWTGAVPTRDGGTRESTFNFKQDGEKLTGTMTGPQGDIELKDGTVKGDDVAFNVALSFNGNDVKLNYKGKIAGEEIKFTRTREGADQKQEFTVKRAK